MKTLDIGTQAIISYTGKLIFPAKLLCIFTISLLLVTSIASADGILITVDDDGAADFSTIQDAIDAANDGDTILVLPGTYNENINVNKSVTIESTDGTDVTNVIAISTNDHVFKVTADGVTISGFNISGATGSNYIAGIYLEGSSNCTLTNNIVANNGYGIYLQFADYNLIYNNLFNNTVNVEFEGTNTGNQWNIEKTAGSNIIGGPYFGGNYWTTPDGTGFSQTDVDYDNDGICDSSYELDADNIDDLPLTDNIIQKLSAEINYISPTRYPTQGDMIYFSGKSSASYGEIVDYKWTSCRNGVLSDSESFWYNTSNLKPGGHTISFSVKGDQGEWFEANTSYLIVNGAPTANIVSISSKSVTEGDPVSFEGSGTDSDGTIENYNWSSSIDGYLNSSASFITSDLSEGTHTIYFSVQDNKSAWSDVATANVVVNGVPNQLPTANIVSISPDLVTEGNTVFFSGNGTDSDGTIENYNWSSSINGDLSSSASFNTTNLSEGTHTISFSVQDDDGEWSDVAIENIVVNKAPNQLPTANIVLISPKSVTEGDSVLFEGNGTDFDGTIESYNWSSSINGYLSNSASFNTTNLSIGTHTISFSVQDNDGEWSDIVTENIVVSEVPNQLPTANIVSISPDQVTEGSTVYFSGNGSDTDGTITAYNWTSSIDDSLSGSANFSTSTLSIGIHTILFSVQDNDGEWSDAVSLFLNVSEAPVQNGDDSAPVLVSVSPTSGSTLAAGTSSVNINFTYSDNEADINTSSIVFVFNDVDVTADSNTTITSTSAQYNATGLSAGNYSASVYVVDTAGNSATFNTSFTIAQASSSSSSSSSKSSSSSGGGGGGGSSGESYANIVVKEAESIFVTKSAHVVYEFSDEDNAISTVEFDSLKTGGSITAIVEVLKDRSSFANEDAPDEVYQQMNIWVGKVGFVNPNNVEALLITFRVEQSWLTENNVEAGNVLLYRYSDDTWNELSTTVTDEDDEYVYFESETPGFSSFVIAGDSEPEVVVEEELRSVNDEDSVTLDEEASEVETTSTGISTAGILVVLGLFAVVLAGGYILYRKQN